MVWRRESVRVWRSCLTAWRRRSFRTDFGTRTLGGRSRVSVPSSKGVSPSRLRASRMGLGVGVGCCGGGAGGFGGAGPGGGGGVVAVVGQGERDGVAGGAVEGGGEW